MINIAGWSKFSTVDWPDKIVATLFLQGCPWRCNYCHNYEILDPNIKGDISFDEVLEFLKKRKGLIDGVVFSGGEPTLQDNLLDAIIEVKNLGFKLGLHSGGAYPHKLSKILKYIDWIGFDIKATPQKYKDITQLSNSWNNTNQSLELLKEYNGEVQFRTTYDKTVLNDNDIQDIQKMLKDYNFPSNINTNLVVQECLTKNAPPSYQV